MAISRVLESFLKGNKIYSIGNLTELTIPFVATLPGYTKEIGNEIRRLRRREKFLTTSTKATVGDLRQSTPNHLGRITFVRKDGKELFALSDSSVSISKKIVLSTRLLNVLVATNYNQNFTNFLSLNDDALMNVQNFGRTCLAEFHQIRKILQNFSNNLKLSFPEVEKTDYVLDAKQKAHVPKELGELEFETVFLFVDGFENLTSNTVTKLLNRFCYLRELDKKTFDDLLEIKGLGRKAVGFLWDWLSRLHASSFEELQEKLAVISNQHNLSTSTFECSFLCNQFLLSCGIDSLAKISNLEKLIQSRLSRVAKIAILELRTLYFDPVASKFKTKSNSSKMGRINLPLDIDTFLDDREAIRIAELDSKNVPDEILKNILSCKTGFTIVRGINPMKTKDTNYRLKHAEKIINNPQAQRLIKHKKIYFQSFPDKRWNLLTVPSIRPEQGFENPTEYVCPDQIDLYGMKVTMIKDKYTESIKLILYTSEEPLTGAKFKNLNRIDFLGKIGVIASYHISEIGLFSSGFIEFIYGECSSPIMEDPDEDYVKNDRVEFVRAERSEALLKWVQQCVNDLARKLEEQQRKQRRGRDLQNTSNFNKILNTWNHQFIKAMLKDQLFGDGSEMGIGGKAEKAPIIGKQAGQESGKKGTKQKGTRGDTDTRKAPKHPTVLVSSHDKDPLSDNERVYDCDPRQPAVHQHPIDVPHGIYWINTSKPLAELILNRDGADSSRWRYYLFQRHIDIIIKEAVFQMGKSELSLTSDGVNQKIDEIIAKVHDKAAEDLVSFLFDEGYKV